MYKLSFKSTDLAMNFPFLLLDTKNKAGLHQNYKYLKILGINGIQILTMLDTVWFDEL